MDRIQRVFKPQQHYEPIHDSQEHDDAASSSSSSSSCSSFSEERSQDAFDPEQQPFSHVEYWIFLLMGVAMLWAWNMFLAAAPYFQMRFASDPWILTHFQSAEISVSTVTNLVAMGALSKLQKKANYPYRIVASLCINTICFTLLALSALVSTSARVYFGFLLVVIFVVSLATALSQNGIFAYVSGFGRSEYTQAIMTGQAVAGILPCLVQIGSVLAVPSKERESSGRNSGGESPESAFAYFLTATAICIISFLAFLHLLRRRRRRHHRNPLSTQSTPSSPSSSIPKSLANDAPSAEPLLINDPHHHSSSPTTTTTTTTSPPPPPTPPRKSIPLTTLLLLLPSLSTAIFLCFVLTMITPVFTTRIPSLHPHLLPPPLFIPLATLIWSCGDLLGRLLTLFPPLRLTQHPFALLCLSLARLIFVPLYLLCNVGGRGAVVPSDVFYLLVVQLLFGLTNGYVGSSCMMGAGEWVAEDEREAAGGYMALCLVAGLTVGSLLSFMVGDLV